MLAVTSIAGESHFQDSRAHLQDLWVHARPGPVVLEDGVRHLNGDATRLREEKVCGQPRNHQAPCSMQQRLNAL